MQVEPLEARTLMAGFTFVTHGFSFTGDYPIWTENTAIAVADRAGQSGVDVARYLLRLLDNDQDIGSKRSGPGLDSASTGEALLELDWAQPSNNFEWPWDTSGRADLIALDIVDQWLLSPFGQGATRAFVELPIHLIGHSRGASVISEVAKLLGQRGVWVDQVTFLDPHPLVTEDWFVEDEEADPAVRAYENVIFADDYWRTDGDGGDFDGQAVANTHKVQLSENTLLSGGYDGALEGGEHSDVHLWYYGTVDTSDGANNGDKDVPGNWYQGNMGPRATNGFHFSRIGGGARPSDGVYTLFGGTAGRSAVGRVGAQWPNVINLSLNDYSVTIGQTVKINYKYGDYDSGGSVALYLDTDENPYNGNAGQIGSKAYNATGTGVASGQFDWNTTEFANKAGKSYFVYARINDGGRTRYAYTGSKVALSLGALQVVATPDPVDIGQSVTITAKNVTDPDGISKVSFFLDWNANRKWDNGIDLALGTAVKQGNSYNWVLANRTVGSMWGTGPTMLCAQIIDGLGHVNGDPKPSTTIGVRAGGPRVVSVSASPDPVRTGETLTLSAKAQDDGAVTKVTFFYDRNRDGVWSNGVDWALGAATNQGQGMWSLGKLLGDAWKSEVGSDRRFVAQAQDNLGKWSVRLLADSVRIDPPGRPGRPPSLDANWLMPASFADATWVGWLTGRLRLEGEGDVELDLVALEFVGVLRRPLVRAR